MNIKQYLHSTHLNTAAQANISEQENTVELCRLPLAEVVCFRANSDRFYFQYKNEIRSYNLVKKK